jgi:uncharacterized protein (TIGR03435 family)
MKTNYRLALIATAVVYGLSAQDVNQGVEFDVATVKPSEQPGPTPTGRGSFSYYSGCSGGPGTTDPGRFTCTSVSLRTLVERAWNLRGYQVAAPGALDGARYDVAATVPKDTAKEQFGQMLQSLLAERFHLLTHHEKREQEVYSLSIAKGGHKLQTPQPGDSESPRDALTRNANGDGKAKPMSDSDMSPEEAALKSELQSRVAAMLAGRAGRAGERPPSHIASSSVNGITRLAGRRATMADLIGFLSSHLDRPVIDHTQLAGEWNFLAEYAFDPRQSPLRQALPVGPAPVAQGDPSTPSGGESIAAAFQKQLGLKLEVVKEPADLLVVDRFDKTPTAN